DVIRAVDVAIAHAVLQRYAPGPAGIERPRARAGRNVCRIRVGTGEGYGTIAHQPVVPVDEAGLQGFLDEQAMKAAAVDVEATGQCFPIVEPDAANVFGFALAQHFGYARIDAAHTERFGESAQVGGESPCERRRFQRSWKAIGPASSP